MRQICFLIALPLCAAGSAFAQVTVDLHALDALSGAKPATREAPARRTLQRPPPQAAAAEKSAKAPTEQAAARPPASTGATAAPPPPVAPPSPPAATLPSAAPPTVALAPIAPPPPAPQTAPPPPPPISDSASSAATSTSAGLRVTFGAGEAELSPASATAIHGFVRSAPPGDATSFNVVAYAAGTPEDPSTARRLSLARALAVRSALIAEGIGSARIYVRALGAASGDEPPDRVDLAVLGGNAATPASAPGQPPAGVKSRQQ